MAFTTYILKSISYNTYCYSSKNNLYKRLKEHNKRRVRYTKGRMPWIIHYVEDFETRSEAMQREKSFKSIEGYNFLKSNKVI